MADNPIRALLVEDNPGDARLIQEMLSEVGQTAFTLKCADKLSTGLECLEQGDIDVILLDLSLPDSHGFDTFTTVHNQVPAIPVVVLSGLSDEELALKAVGEGAQDYLVKGQVDSNVLARSMRYAVERRRLQDEVERTQQQQLSMRDEFLSHVSHELRTPLTAIHQFNTILLDGLAGELTTEQRDYLDIMLKNVLQLRAMIGDLLQITRAQMGKLAVEPKCTFIPDIINDTIATLSLTAANKNIMLFDEISPDIIPGYVDPERVREILINLIENAIKFTPQNGTITIRAEVFKKDPNFLCLSVTDTGQGISPEEMENIFGYLYQIEDSTEASRKGLGLGLYICKTLVSLHGGRIWVESEIGQGSTFYFTLPVFALAGLLNPVLTAKLPLSRSVALLTVEVFPARRRRLTKVDEVLLRQVWEILDRAPISNKDLLLPRLTQTNMGEAFFIVSCSDQHGADGLAERIQDQLTSYKDLRNAGLNVEVSSSIVDVPSAKKNKTLPQLVMDVETSIEELVRSSITEFTRKEKLI